MTTQKKLAVIFLAVLNVMNIAAGVITQIKIFRGSDVVSVLPIFKPMTANQTLMLNFVCVVAVIVLISVGVTYLVTDISYTPKEIFLNCPGILVVLPVIIFAFGVFNAVNTVETADKVWIVLSLMFFVLANVVNFGCIITIKDD